MVRRAASLLRVHTSSIFTCQSSLWYVGLMRSTVELCSHHWSYEETKEAAALKNDWKITDFFFLQFWQRIKNALRIRTTLLPISIASRQICDLSIEFDPWSSCDQLLRPITRTRTEAIINFFQRFERPYSSVNNTRQEFHWKNLSKNFYALFISVTSSALVRYLGDGRQWYWCICVADFVGFSGVSNNLVILASLVRPV